MIPKVPQETLKWVLRSDACRKDEDLEAIVEQSMRVVGPILCDSQYLVRELPKGYDHGTSMTIEQALAALLTNHIDFSDSVAEQASTSHNHIRDLLQNKANLDSTFPWLVEGDFLAGSYARGTAIAPLDDVDVIMVLDGHGLTAWDEGVQLGQVVRGSGHPGSPVGRYTDATGMVSSARILQVFHEGLKESYPDSAIRKDGQCVNVWLDSYGLGLDIVPAFHIVPSVGKDVYFIPTGGGSAAWMKTNPKIDIRIARRLQEQHNNLFKRLCRLLRYWNVERNASRLSGYHVEVIAWRIFDTHPGIASLQDGLSAFFAEAESSIANACPDPTGVTTLNVDRALSASDRALSVAAAGNAHEATLRGELFELQGKLTLALAEYRKVVGTLM